MILSKNKLALTLSLASTFCISNTAFSAPAASYEGNYDVSCKGADNNGPDGATHSYYQFSAFTLTGTNITPGQPGTDDNNNPIPGDGYQFVTTTYIDLPESQIPNTRFYLQCNEDSGLLEASQASLSNFSTGISFWCSTLTGASIDILNQIGLIDYQENETTRDQVCANFSENLAVQLEDEINLRTQYLHKPIDSYDVTWTPNSWFTARGWHDNTHQDGSLSREYRALNTAWGNGNTVYNIQNIESAGFMIPGLLGAGCIGNTYGRDDRAYTLGSSANYVEGKLKKGYALTCATYYELSPQVHTLNYNLELVHHYDAVASK
ncbi:hypothetical protein A9Q99_17830 [Gammaproteobacteria bacterium 45_16_T64]|nr:hypothetical protein A9Q99_17830 [Gammaproteobacteria bacterium 45_16_T64]